MAAKRILLITTGQPATNPRLVKEANTLAAEGYQVQVLYCYWSSWGLKYDQALLAQASWKASCMGGSPKRAVFTYFFTRVRQKMAAWLLSKGWSVGFAYARFQARAFDELLGAAKKHVADLYIAHTLGALPVAALAAKHHRRPFVFDAEDYHRHEVSDILHHNSFLVAKYLEDKYLPLAAAITAASPGISYRYREHYPKVPNHTVHNVFDDPGNASDVPRVSKDAGLHLVWFSQTIGPYRGLEEAIQAIALCMPQAIFLHLVGNVSPQYAQHLHQSWQDAGLVAARLKMYSPMHPDMLVPFVAQFDVGLALERTIPTNRAICLTNKIFTYMAGGLAIAASATEAQGAFMQQHPDIGAAYPPGNAAALAAVLKKMADEPYYLQQCKAASKAAHVNRWNVRTEYSHWLEFLKNEGLLSQ